MNNNLETHVKEISKLLIEDNNHKIKKNKTIIITSKNPYSCGKTKVAEKVFQANEIIMKKYNCICDHETDENMYNIISFENNKHKCGNFYKNTSRKVGLLIDNIDHITLLNKKKECFQKY